MAMEEERNMRVRMRMQTDESRCCVPPPVGLSCLTPADESERQANAQPLLGIYDIRQQDTEVWPTGRELARLWRG